MVVFFKLPNPLWSLFDAINLNPTAAVPRITPFTASAAGAPTTSAHAPKKTGPISIPTSPHVRYVAKDVPRFCFGPDTSAAYAAGAGPIAACAAAHAIDDAMNNSFDGAMAVAKTASVDTDIAPTTTFRRGKLSANKEAGQLAAIVCAGSVHQP